MRKLFLSLSVVTLLTIPLNLTSFRLVSSAGSPQIGQKQALQKRQEQLDQRHAEFEPGRSVLDRKQVPFDPDVLLTPNWRETLAPKFASMPEMQEVRAVGDKVKGAQLAHTLYLPEKVELEGDTVFLVRNLVFAGKNPVIQGPFNVYIYPIEQTGVLGTSLKQALRNVETPFVNASFGSHNKLPLLPILEGESLTIDTHGLGRADWIRSQQRAGSKGSSAGMVKVAMLPQGGINNNGAYGTDGAPAGIGATGTTGAGGNPGTNGVCGTTTTVNGGNGSPGVAGGTGVTPAAGGDGGDAGAGGTIVFDLGDYPLPYYNFSSDGGGGGNGGPGGQGGTGGNGGTGGIGGTGANCACNQGGSGAGGIGGTGGTAGQGGNGSKGGDGKPGKNGGSITITYPLWYGTSTINRTANGGPGGSGAIGGSPGQPGSPGGGGGGGNNGGVSICENQGNSGANGSTGSTNGIGSQGAPGNTAAAGSNGSITLIPRASCFEPPEDCSVYGDPPMIWRGYPTCACVDRPSPVILDIEGNGFALCSAADGVHFDLNADGAAEKLSWVAAGSDDALLALDLNGNGKIDSGAELFGNYTPQPPSKSPNGFAALAEFDTFQNGGDGNGVIDAHDAIYSELRLWQDRNHDGVSDSGELQTLPKLGIKAIHLDYSYSKRLDQFDNLFYYAARVDATKGSALGKVAYDVYFVPGD